MVVLSSVPQQRVDLVDEDLIPKPNANQLESPSKRRKEARERETHDRRLHLPCEREQSSDELVALSVPLVGQCTQRDVDLPPTKGKKQPYQLSEKEGDEKRSSSRKQLPTPSPKLSRAWSSRNLEDRREGLL